jgi:hypothetical protein
MKETRGTGAVKIKARHIVAGTGKSLLDYVIRRFNASLAELKSPRGWTFAETPLNAISTPVKRSQPNQVPFGGRLVWMVPVFPEPTTQKKKL